VDGNVTELTSTPISPPAASAASVSKTVAGAQEPLFAKGSPRVLGFCTGDRPERLEEYASYTNVVRTRIEHLDTVAPIARRHGLRVVVNVKFREPEPAFHLEDSFVETVRRHRDVVAAVHWQLLPRLECGQAEIAQFGQQLKTSLPEVQFWCGFAVLQATVDAIDEIPSEVDCVSLYVPNASDPDTVAKNAEAIVSWLARANRYRRPTVLTWARGFARERSNIAALQQWVERFNLDGLILGSYSEENLPIGRFDGIGDDENATAAVKEIAAAWGVPHRVDRETPREPAAATIPGTDQPARQEYALLFDGIKSHVDMAEYAYNGKYPITVEAYVVPLSHRFGVQHVFSNRGGDGSGIWLYLTGIRRHWAFQLKNPIPPESTEEVPLSRRVHIAGVYDLQRNWLFVDGKQQGDPIRTGFYGPAHKYSYIGADPNHYKKVAGPFHGIIEQFRISLTARYQGDFTPEPVLQSDNDTLVLYRFEEGFGRRARDLSGNGYDGVIKDAKWVKLKDYLEPEEVNSTGGSDAPDSKAADTETAEPAGGIK
jgi:hypothetical protein